MNGYTVNSRMKILVIFLAILLSGCVEKPEGISPVSNFEVSRYLGRWYEIARLPHSFEEGLTQVMADYSLRDDGGLKVINRGYSTEDKEWSVAEGKAFFVENKNTGYLKVSFFGPFYGSYIVFNLDETNYRYSFVTGNDREYLWLMSRTPTVSQTVASKFQQQAAELGFDTSKLIWREPAITP